MFWELVLIENECLDISVFRKKDLVFLKLGFILGHYDLGVTVLGDVETGLRGVGGVDPSWN